MEGKGRQQWGCRGNRKRGCECTVTFGLVRAVSGRQFRVPASPVVAQASRALEHPMNSGEDNPAVIGIIVAVKVGIDPLQRIDIRPFLRSLFHPSIRIPCIHSSYP